MSIWTLLYIYVGGAALVALRIGWHILFRLDRYDWMYCDVWPTFWLDVILWPLFMIKPTLLIHPKFSEPWWCEGRAENERQMDRLEANPPPCSELIRYSPEHDQWDKCSGEYFFSTNEVVSIMEKRLAELSTEERWRYPGILHWLRQTDGLRTDPVEVPAPWSEAFVNVAIGMMNRQLGQVRCKVCDEAFPHEQILLEWEPKGLKGSGWRFNVWRCPNGHKLLTKDSLHIYAPSAATTSDTDSGTRP